MRSLFFCLLTLSVLIGAVLALDTGQTDWSGGDGVPGPVTDWGSQFDASTTVDWSSSPGDLTLGYVVQETLVTESVDKPNAVVAGFIDGDDDVDLVCSSESDRAVVWFDNTDGSGGAWAPNLAYTMDGVQYLHLADADGDGDNDIFFGTATLYGGGVGWLENDGSGSTWDRHTVGSGKTSSVFAIDMDGDDDTDVVASLVSAGELVWWSNDDGAGGSWTSHTITDSFLGAESVFVADIDGDTDLDVVAAAKNDEVAWWSNDDGAGTSWTKHEITLFHEGASSVYAADMDGDADADVVATALIGDLLVWWSNDDGVGESWSHHTVDDDFNGANSVIATDLDGDTDVDIVAAGIGERVVAWWENVDGSGSTLIKHELTTDFRGAWFVYVDDVNGDGKDDIVSCAGFDNEVRWWDLFAPASSGDLTS
ncbi:VCBS repeat-containing protein, partial [bacterium]|nr:VCBS repeat-containing protein [bacterium]